MPVSLPEEDETDVLAPPAAPSQGSAGQYRKDPIPREEAWHGMAWKRRGHRQWLQTLLFPSRLQAHTLNSGLSSVPLFFLRRIPTFSCLGFRVRASYRRTGGPGAGSAAAFSPHIRIAAAIWPFAFPPRAPPPPPPPHSEPPTMLDLDVEAKSREMNSTSHALKVIDQL